MDKKPVKQPRKISARYLENAALYYLQRYASSEENLRRVLTRKVNRSCRFHGMSPDEFYPVIDVLITRYAASGLLNDKVFAESKVASLRRRGRSKQAIMANLTMKGLKKDTIQQALDETDDSAEAELIAAVALAKRKKIGAFRKKPAQTPEKKKKDLAVLGRAGFSYDIALRALQYREEEDALFHDL